MLNDNLAKREWVSYEVLLKRKAAWMRLEARRYGFRQFCLKEAMKILVTCHILD